MNISFKYEQLYVLNASATSKCTEESLRIHAVSPGPSLPIRTQYECAEGAVKSLISLASPVPHSSTANTYTEIPTHVCLKNDIAHCKRSGLKNHSKLYLPFKKCNFFFNIGQLGTKYS